MPIKPLATIATE